MFKFKVMNTSVQYSSVPTCVVILNWDRTVAPEAQRCYDGRREEIAQVYRCVQQW